MEEQAQRNGGQSRAMIYDFEKVVMREINRIFVFEHLLFQHAQTSKIFPIFK